MLSGGRTLVRICAIKPGKVIQLNRQNMMDLLQSDAELGEIIMRAFILRRVEMVASGTGDIVLDRIYTFIRYFLYQRIIDGNGHPYSYIDIERDQDV